MQIFVVLLQTWILRPFSHIANGTQLKLSDWTPTDIRIPPNPNASHIETTLSKGKAGHHVQK